jgi:bifunctional enzyme CysN/CysC
VSNAFKARIFWMSDVPLCPGESLTVRLATQSARATVTVRSRMDSSSLDELGEGPLSNNEVGEVTVDADRQLAFTPFDEVPELGRFVLVRGEDIIAGGIVSGEQALAIHV